MAIIENGTNNYYKINFDKCSIKGRAVFVNFSVYNDNNEREKEKTREDKVAKFFLELRQYIDTKYKLLLGEIGERKPEELLSDSDGKIDIDNFPLLRAMQDEVNELLQIEQALGNSMYKYDEQSSAIKIPQNKLLQLNELGFNKSWVTEPVYISSGAEVYCGEYNDEHIDMQFYYDRLKTVMGENILDC